MKRALVAAVIAAAALGRGRAQQPAPPPARIDFARDVQPILRQHCYGCHGPTIRQAGLRLDRRSDAMRGGTIAVIGPGTSEASRLYLRVAGTAFGPRMPPTAALTDAQIATIKDWIDQGAVWPDEAAGEAPPRPTPPLMRAVLYEDAAAVRRLLEAGADPNARNSAGATALMWAVGEEAKTRLLLEHGADVNAVSDEGRTPLIIAAGLHGAAPIVRLLLGRGATVAAQPMGSSPLFDALYTGDESTFKMLVDAGLDLQNGGAFPLVVALVKDCRPCAELIAAKLPPSEIDHAVDLMLPPNPGGQAIDFLVKHGVDRAAIEKRQRAIEEKLSAIEGHAPAPAPAASPRAAAARSLPLLQRGDASFLAKSGCVSCHNNSLVAMAVAAARTHGIPVDEAISRGQREATARYVESWRERALVGTGIPGDHDSISYILLGLAAERHPRDEATDAMAWFLARMQDTNGQWRIIAQRPPIESSDIEVTAASMRALQLYAPPIGGDRFKAAVGRAAAWLLHAQAQTTEDRAFRLLGLAWSGAARGAIEQAARELTMDQRADGGWAQLPALRSDAYATGQALVALVDSGAVTSSDAAVRSGMQFLVSTQLADGSWFVKTRAMPVQPFFESGFPHGRSQFISAAATAWATQALALAAR